MSTAAKAIEKVSQHKKQSQLVEVWKRLLRNKTAILGLIIVSTLILLALFAPLMFDYDGVVIKQNIKERLRPHLLHIHLAQTRWVVTSLLELYTEVETPYLLASWRFLSPSPSVVSSVLSPASLAALSI